MAKIHKDKIKGRLAEFFMPVLESIRTIPRNYFNVLIFLILPVMYLLNITIFHYSFGPFYLNRVDPEYFYMYNGVVLGAGNLSIQYFAHPGTPLHYLITFSSRITDLFQPGDYMQSFVDDPEKYIHSANLLINVLISLVLLFSGIRVYRYTKSVLAGFLIQIVPFGNMELFSLSGRVFPEALLIIPFLLTSVLVIRYVFRDDREDGAFNYEVFFGIIIGFGIALKLTFIPVALIPLILMKRTLKRKVFFLLYTLLFFMIFAYPVVFNGNVFWNWISGIFSHSGKYGTGAKGFINLTEVPGNFIALIKANQPLFITGTAASVLALIFLSLRPERNSISHKAIRAIFAVSIALLAAIAFTLKHFSLYYFTPFASFTFVLILLAIILILKIKAISSSNHLKITTIILFSILVLFMVSIQLKEIRSGLKINYSKAAIARQERDSILSLIDPQKPLIISGKFDGAPFIEFAQFNGFIMSARLKGFYKEYLKEKYPNCYFYVYWSEGFNYWSDPVGFDKILEKTASSFYIFTGKDNQDDLKIIEGRIWKFIDSTAVSKKVLFLDQKSGEQLIEITVEKKVQ